MLANNINLHPISHCFQIIADYWSNIHFHFQLQTLLHWVPDVPYPNLFVTRCFVPDVLKEG